MIVSILQRTRDRSWLPGAAFAILLTIGAAPPAIGVAAPAAPASTPAEPLAVKVLVINMFKSEAAPWLPALDTREIRVPGLSCDYPLVPCDPRRCAR